MINRHLRSDLLNKLKVSKQALSQRSKRLKETYGPMTTEEAVYVIAHMAGIDITRYLPLTVIDRVRSLVPRNQAVHTSKNDISTPKKKNRPQLGRPYPLISSIEHKQAKVIGTDVFPLIYQLENSLRHFIERVLSKSGTDWWAIRVPADVQSNVQRTINKEKRYPYRDKRGSDLLYYANFDDLKKIIIDGKNKIEFQAVIIDIEWFKVKMDEVYMARNNLAHCAPLTKDDISRISLFHRDWARLLDAAGLK